MDRNFKELICSKVKEERSIIFYKLMTYIRDRIPYEYEAKDLYEFIIELCSLNETSTEEEFRNSYIWSMIDNYKNCDTFRIIMNNSLSVE